MKPIAAVVAALVLCGPALLAPDAARAQHATDPGLADPAVRAPLDAYLRGHATGDPEAFRQAFHPDAELWGLRANGDLARMTAEQYIAGASGRPAADEAARLRWIESIDVSGDVATARITLSYPTVLFVDYMSLMRIEGRWWIVNKMFQAHPPVTPPAVVAD